MPTYEYRCKDCGHELEAQQAFSDDPLTECPSCGGALKKRFGSVGISFKGSGFYKNDSRGSSGSSSTSSADTGSGSTGSESGSASSAGSSGSGSSDTSSSSTSSSSTSSSSTSSPAAASA